MDMDIDIDDLMCFSLGFVFFLSVSTTLYTGYSCLFRPHAMSLRRFVRLFVLVFVTVVYGLLLFGIIQVRTNVSAFLARVCAMFLLSLVFVGTYREGCEGGD